MRSMRISTALFLILLPIMAVRAQDEVTDEVPEIRRYTVEMIIFKYAQDVSTGTEIFPPDKPVAPDPIPDDEARVVEEEPLEEIPRYYRDNEIELLDEDDYTMGDILRRLERLDVYEPVMHFGWTQITWPDEDTLPIELEAMGRLPDGLGGTLRLYLSRFLHLVVDLELDAPESHQSTDSRPGYGDYRSLSDYDDFGSPMPVRYRIEEDRIFKSGELRYFDHPKFGALARVTRVEDESEAPADEMETELLGYPVE